MTTRSRQVAGGATLPASPTPHELGVAPELALLTALHQVLELTALTLAAIHPDVGGDRDCLVPLDLRAALADQIIDLGACLAKATTSYRIAVIASLHAPDIDDLPF